MGLSAGYFFDITLLQRVLHWQNITYKGSTEPLWSYCSVVCQ